MFTPFTFGLGTALIPTIGLSIPFSPLQFTVAIVAILMEVCILSVLLDVKFPPLRRKWSTYHSVREWASDLVDRFKRNKCECGT
jgi:hypothetical protein